MNIKHGTKIRLNVDLSPEVAKALVEMAKQQDVSLSEAVHRAIRTESFLRTKRASNGKVLIDEGNGIIKELVFT